MEPRQIGFSYSTHQDNMEREMLKVYDYHTGDRYLEIILDIVEQSVNLKTLCFHGVHFKKESWMKIFDAVEQNVYIINLNFENCSGEHVICHIINMVKNNKTVKLFYMRGDDFSIAQCYLLANLVEHNTSLKALDLYIFPKEFPTSVFFQGA